MQLSMSRLWWCAFTVVVPQQEAHAFINDGFAKLHRKCRLIVDPLNHTSSPGSPRPLLPTLGEKPCPKQLLSKLTSPVVKSSLVMGQASMFVALVLSNSATATIGCLLSGLSQVVVPFVQDATTQAEVLNDLSHVALDLVTILGVPSSGPPVRLLTVVGRLLLIAADYIPDQHIAPDELLFQLVMLSLAWSDLSKSIMSFVVSSVVATTSPRTTIRDGRAFSLLFQPAGLKWNQYKTLSASIMDWVCFKEGDTFEIKENATETFLFWLYNGNLTLQNEDSDVPAVSFSRSARSKNDVGKALHGDLALLKRLDAPLPSGRWSRNPSKHAAAEAPKDVEDNGTSVKAVVGEGGATILRINASLLLHWIREYDEKLEPPIRKLLLRGVQEKMVSVHGSAN